MTMTMPGLIPKIPVTIITGFLGAGKTTLLNALLKSETLHDAIVIVNEFGEIGLDHLFIETRDDGMILMASGCLCCTIRGDLVDTLDDLMRKRDTGQISPFARIIIETTGLADPAPILQSILSHPYLAARYALNGVVTLIDAVNGHSTLDLHSEAVKQAAVADRLVLTKTDLLAAGSDEIARLGRRLRTLNPGAPVLNAAAQEATVAALIDCGPFDIQGKIPDVARWLNAEAYAKHSHNDHDDDHGHHTHDGHAEDAHDINRHDKHIRAFCLSTEQAIPATAFELFLSLLRSAHGEKLLRMKGIVRLAETPDQPVILHGVQHVFHPPIALKAWPDADHRTRMVFITRDLDETFVAGLWNAFLGRPGIDTADRAAMVDNPLSLRNA